MKSFETAQIIGILEGMDRDGITVPPVSVVISDRTLRTLSGYARSNETRAVLGELAVALTPGRQGLVRVLRGMVPAHVAAGLAGMCELVIPVMPAGMDRGAVKSDRELLSKELTRVLIETALAAGIAA